MDPGRLFERYREPQSYVGWSDIDAERVAAVAPVLEHLPRIERNVGLADGVITALSSFARMPVPEMRPIPVEAMVREVLEINPPGARSRSPSIALGPALRTGRRRSAPDRAGEPDPQRSRRHARGGRLVVAARAEDGHLDITVADTGSGIDRSELSRIMEPPYSTEARGLGLAIVRSIVEKNQVIIQVDSEPGRGSVFTLRLVAAPGEGVAAS